jgi:alpha/beta superfamily hydrolase
MPNQLLNITKKLAVPGEHEFFFSGAAGQLEAVLSVPPEIRLPYIAILGHPHSLQGGTMNNKVVTTMARLFKELGIPSIRFNFRGVGQSAGAYDEGVGEAQDMEILAHLVLKEQPNVQLIFAGFSFGSYVTYQAAAHCPHALLISIAPPVHHYNFTEFLPGPMPWIVAQGDEDEVVPVSLVLDFVSSSSPSPLLLKFEKTGHFFHGRLVELKHRLMEAIRRQVGLI